MLKKTSGFIVNLLLSAFIGFLVGMVLFLSGYILDNVLYTLFSSSCLGILIGSASKLSSCFAYECGLKHRIWSYGLTFIITLLGCWALSDPFKPSWSKLLPSIIIAEPLSLFAAYLNMRYAERLNDSLKRKQTKLQQLT